MNFPPLEKRAEDAAVWFVREMFDCLNKGPEQRTREGWQGEIAWWLREVSQVVPLSLDRPQDQLTHIRYQARFFYESCLRQNRHNLTDAIYWQHHLCYSIMLTMGWYRWKKKPSDVELEHFAHYHLLDGITQQMANDGRIDDGPTGYFPTRITAKLSHLDYLKRQDVGLKYRKN